MGTGMQSSYRLYLSVPASNSDLALVAPTAILASRLAKISFQFDF
jgi:hypothetical protein